MSATTTIRSVYLSFGQLQLLEAAADVANISVTGPNKTAAAKLEEHGLGHLEVDDNGWHFAINQHGRDQLSLRASA
jgi:hypothetical protein